MNLVSRWIIQKEKVNEKVQYGVYRQWLWRKKLYAHFDTKQEAIDMLEKMSYPHRIKQG